MNSSFLSSIFTKHKFLSWLTWGLICLIGIIGFISLNIFGLEKSPTFLNNKYSWHTVIQTNKDESTLAQLDNIQQISEKTSNPLIRLVSSLDRSNIGGGVLVSTFYISDFKNITNIEYFGTNNSILDKNSVLISKQLWLNHQKELTDNFKFIKLNEKRRLIAGVFSNEIRGLNVDIIAPLESYSDTGHWRTTFPGELIIVGLKESDTKTKLEESFNKVAASSSLNNRSYLKFKKGVYTSNFDIESRDNFKFVTKENSLILILCFTMVTAIFAQKISQDIIRMLDICYKIGFPRRAVIEFYSTLLIDLTVRTFFLVLSAGFLLQIIIKAISGFINYLILPSNLLTFLLAYVPLAFIVSIAFSILALSIIVCNIYFSRLTNIVALRFSQIRLSIHLVLSFLLAVYGIIFIQALMPKVDNIGDKLEFAKNRSVFIFELESKTKNTSSFGKVIKSQSTEKLKEALAKLKGNNEIKSYSGSSMYPFFNGGSYRNYKSHNGKPIKVYVNSIFGDYFSQIKYSAQFSSLDDKIIQLTPFTELISSASLTKKITELEYQRLLNPIKTMDLNGEFQNKNLEVKAHKSTIDLPYNGFTNKSLPVAYIENNSSATLNFISIIPGPNYSKESYETIKLSLPADLQIKKSHELVEIARKDMLNWLLKLFFITIILLSLLFLVINIVDMSIKTFYSDLKDNIKIMRDIGASTAKIQLYIFKSIMPPLIFSTIVSIYLYVFYNLTSLGDFKAITIILISGSLILYFYSCILNKPVLEGN